MRTYTTELLRYETLSYTHDNIPFLIVYFALSRVVRSISQSDYEMHTEVFACRYALIIPSMRWNLYPLLSTCIYGCLKGIKTNSWHKLKICYNIIYYTNKTLSCCYLISVVLSNLLTNMSHFLSKVHEYTLVFQMYNSILLSAKQ